MTRFIAFIVVGAGLLAGCGGGEKRPDDPLSPRYALAMRAGARAVAIGNLLGAETGYRRAVTEAEIQANAARQAKAWYALAGVRARAGDHRGALDALAEAMLLETEPRFTTHAVLLASAVHAEAGDPVAARSSLNQALAFDPGKDRALATELTLAEARVLLAEGRLDRASELMAGFERSESPSVFKLRGAIAEARSDHERAAEHFEQAAARADELVDPILKIEMLRRAALAWSAAGQTERAAAHALVAGRGFVSLDLKPELAEASYRLALEAGSAAGRDDIIAAARRGLQRFETP